MYLCSAWALPLRDVSGKVSEVWQNNFLVRNPLSFFQHGKLLINHAFPYRDTRFLNANAKSSSPTPSLTRIVVKGKMDVKMIV